MRSFSGCGRKPWVPSSCAGDLRELLRVPLRSQGYCGVGRALSGLHWLWCNGRGPHLELSQEPQGSSPFLTPIAGSLPSSDRRVRPRLVWRNGPRFSIVCSWYLLSADSNWPGTRGKKHGGLKLPPVLWGLQEPTRHQLVGEI